MSGICEKLIDVQSRLKAPKSQRNDFGKYNYRNCEDILEAVKPLLKENGLYITLQDSIEVIGNRVYVKATATIGDNENNTMSVSAYAREEESKKGMDGSQITGSSSSYARKYAMNGLFAIDDTKDSDTINDKPKSETAQAKEYKCCVCGKPFESFTAKSTGKKYTAAQAYHISETKHGRPLCGECAKKEKSSNE